MIERITLRNSSGASLDVINLGAAITALRVPDRFGELQDIVLGYDEPKSYLRNPDYFGVVVGRFANRIANGRFRLNDTEYQLARNEGAHHLHGGASGFHQQLWSVAQLKDAPDENNVRLTYLSKEGDENYPGNLTVSVSYCLTEENELIIDYLASTDKHTIVNLTQHSYFNLGGHNSGNILDHEIRINANRFTPVGRDQIPTGAIEDVRNTPLDLQEFQRIGDVIDQPHQQLKYGGGLDHNYVIKEQFDPEMRVAAKVREPRSGRVMQVITDQPGVQLYTGNFIGAGTIGKNGAVYNRRQGLCLETQHFPDAPNHSHFPSVELFPGQAYNSRTIYQFSTD